MFPIFVAALLAPMGADTVSLPAPRGNGRLSLKLPPGYRLANRQAREIFLTAGAAKITVTWTGNFVKPPLLKAMKRAQEQYRKQGKVVGPVSIGSYRGVMLKIPLTPTGFDLHSAMISGADLLSVNYFDPSVRKAELGAAIELVRRFIASARLTEG